MTINGVLRLQKVSTIASDFMALHAHKAANYITSFVVVHIISYAKFNTLSNIFSTNISTGMLELLREASEMLGRNYGSYLRELKDDNSEEK